MPFFFVDHQGLKHPTVDRWAYYGIDDPGVCERLMNADARKLQEGGAQSSLADYEAPEQDSLAIPPGLTAADAMSSPVKMIFEDQTLKSATRLFSQNNIRHLPVICQAGKILGVISERDLVNTLAQDLQSSMADFLATPVKNCMAEHALTVTSDTPLCYVLELMRYEGIGCLPVLEGPEQKHLLPNQIWHESFDQGKIKVAGIVTRSDALSCLV